MRKQMYYEYRGRTLVRAIALVAFLGIFGLLALINASPLHSIPTAAFSTMIMAMAVNLLPIVACILAIDSLRRLFSKPRSYLTHLAPVQGYKILTSRVIVICIDLLLALVIGLVVFLLHMKLSGFIDDAAIQQFTDAIKSQNISLFSVCYIIFYALCILVTNVLLFFFAITVKKSYFTDVKASTLLAILVYLVAAWILSFFDAVLLPFSPGYIGIWGLLISPEYPLVPSLPTFLSMFTNLAKVAVLFIPTAWMIQHKMDI